MKHSIIDIIAYLNRSLAHDFRVTPLYAPDAPIFMAVAWPTSDRVTGLKARLPAGRGMTLAQAMRSAGAEAIELRASLAQNHREGMAVLPQSAGRAMVAAHGGVETMALTEDALTEQNLIPAFECGWNHTTLMALRQDRSWTNLQTIHSWPLNIGQIEQQMAHWGDEVLMHHEFARDHTGPVVFGLPLVAYFDRDRLYEIIHEFETNGCVVLDNHVYTIEDGGMKTIDSAQIDFKKIADPHGLMNPGKTRGWSASMAVAMPAPPAAFKAVASTRVP